MLLRILSPIPFWKPFISYDWDTHSAALRKFGILWLISILPLAFAALVSPMGKDLSAIGYIAQFWSHLVKEFNGTHQFIYTVSFITPVLYLVIEHNAQYVQFLKSNKRKAEGVVKFAPDGFGWVLFWSMIVFLFTTAAYAVSTTADLRDETLFLDSISRSTVFIVYLFALLCWYFTILDSTEAPRYSYARSKSKGEDELKNALDQRIAERGE